MKYFGIICVLVLYWTSPVEAQVAGQSSIGKNACGPCAVINSLIGAGNVDLLKCLGADDPEENARKFIRRYGELASETYEDGRAAYTEEAGSTDHDLQMMLNQFLDDQGREQVTGKYVQRESDESNEAYVDRVHQLLSGSIDAGFHPVMSVRALAAEFDHDQGKFLWNSKGGHWVTIHKIGDVSTDGLGFTIEFSDSISAKRLTGYFSHEPFRRSKVPMTFTISEDGEEQWNWVSSSECMLLHAPGMPLGTANSKWYERTIIAVRYVVYKDQAE